VTEPMQAYGSHITPGAPSPSPGFVLLYAEAFTKYAPAYVLSGSDFIIGRDPEAGICVPGGAVSRRHVRIHQRSGRWMIADLGGRNGTIVNGRFITEAPLEHLDEVRVGDAIFKFVEKGAAEYARYRIDGKLVGVSAAGATPNPDARRIVGGYQIHRLAMDLRGIARSTLSVMILGQSGAGKEVFAQQLHEWSGRPGPMRAVNCAAIPPALLESELFGSKRGAFSGADRDRPGLVRSADKGTLFLDEIGDMPLDAQAKLLRMLQSKEILPVGAVHPEPVDVRIVCATHRELDKLQASGSFRGDLYARLREYSLTLPPLAERKEDIFSLCHAMAARLGRSEFEVTFPCMTALLHYDFPFNVRELGAIIKRWAAIEPTSVLDVHHLPSEISDKMKSYGVLASAARAPDAPQPERRQREIPSEQDLRGLLAVHRGNVAAVGRELGKERMQVHRWLKRYRIDLKEYR